MKYSKLVSETKLFMKCNDLQKKNLWPQSRSYKTFFRFLFFGLKIGHYTINYFVLYVTIYASLSAKKCKNSSFAKKKSFIGSTRKRKENCQQQLICKKSCAVIYMQNRNRIQKRFMIFFFENCLRHKVAESSVYRIDM